jgi:ABC-type transport system involved in multi-copper enzyme maturation permease subunit
MSSSETLQPVIEHGWRSGFANLLRKENSLWWGTRKWWVQTLIWLFISNGVIAFILWGIPLFDPSETTNLNSSSDFYALIKVFLQLELFFASFGVMVHSQGLIVNEKKFGTAAWVLSNPVSRSSFIFSKLIGHGWAMFIILVVVQSLVVYLQLALKAGTYYNPLPFIYAIGVMCLFLLFFLALALMLGTLFDSTGPVIGIPIALLIGMNLLPQILGGLAPWLVLVLPISLTDLAIAIAAAQSLPANWYFPLISTGVLIVIFIALAIVRLGREEF